MERVINSPELRGANCKCLPSAGLSDRASETIRGVRSLLTTAEIEAAAELLESVGKGLDQSPIH
jgi:hypothetical protein